jgi:tripartite-type tricarboxylate transporter receptor subunit TctC
MRYDIDRRALLAGLSGTLVSLAGFARAENFPSGPVKIVVTTGPGAAPDVIARIVAERLSRIWGQQAVVINQPGGAGAVAIKAVAPAAPDGHTLYMALASNFIALPELQKNFPVDVLHDFTPIGFVGEQPLMIAVPPSLGVSTLPELIALFKKRPGDLNIAAGNRGSVLHLAGEWLRSETKTQFTLLHYSGGAQALPDIFGGRVQGTIDAIASLRGALDSGKMKALAVTSRNRVPTFPGVPTVAETLPNFEAMGWMALMAPPKMPQALADKISADLRKAEAEPEVQQRIETLGTYVRPTTPAELRSFIEEQKRRWGPVIAATAKAMK